MRFRLLRVLVALIIVGSLSLIITSVLYWVFRIVFDAGIDTLGIGLYFYFFGMIVWGLISTSSHQEKGAIILRNWFDSRLKGFSLRARYQFRLFIFRVGIIAFLGTSIYAIVATYAGEQHVFYIDLFIAGFFLMWFSPLLISDRDIALLFFRRFRNEKIKVAEDLELALKRYNKSVDFRFSSKKLSDIVQYVMHADGLGLEECKSSIDTRLSEIIQSLENKQYAKVPDILVQFSVDCDSFVKRYSDLGIEIRPSLWFRAKDTFSSCLLKILPQLLWLLILLIIYLVLRNFISIDFPFP